MKRLIVVGVALLALLALTTGLSLLRLGWLNSAAALSIALAKASMVLWFFMELDRSRALNRLAFVVALMMLGLLLTLSGADYFTRHETAVPWQQPPPQAVTEGPADAKELEQ